MFNNKISATFLFVVAKIVQKFGTAYRNYPCRVKRFKV